MRTMPESVGPIWMFAAMSLGELMPMIIAPAFAPGIGQRRGAQGKTVTRMMVKALALPLAFGGERG
jgi:hypothetical protein